MDFLVERFLDYVTHDTASDENANVIPSSQGQADFALKLKRELIQLGVEGVNVDRYSCVMGYIPSNLPPGEKVPAIGFIAHMDTAPEFPGNGVKPIVHRSYDGKSIVINKERNIILTPEKSPDLLHYIGHDLITSDGTTLLGVDDKAGIAIIMDALKYIVEHPEFKHGKVCVAFTPDEEISIGGASVFDVERFGADFAYTLDGGEIGEFSYETFNAAEAIIDIRGFCIHTGEAKGRMINASMLAHEFIRLLPINETPERTEGMEGFFHLSDMKGNVEEATLNYLIRDFDSEQFKKRKHTMAQLVSDMNEKYGEERFNLLLNDEYYNMKDSMKGMSHIIQSALRAYDACGVNAKILPVRGGTDGSTLSYKGLPCPNIFLGGNNYHSATEFVSIEAMNKARQVIVSILGLYAESNY